MADVFISYNREDQHRARAIADALAAEGLSVWWDSNLRAGESYDEVTEKNLREAGAVVVLWSKQSVNSKWVRAEATIGERASRLVPAMIEDCDRPLRFELVQAADLIRWHGDRGDPNWRTFIHDIKTAIGHTASAPAQPAAGATDAATASGMGDVTIENTFWTSIKDGGDRSDFEAYLARFPNGHFADLAKNRIAALDRAKTKNPPAAAPAPPRQPEQPPQQPPAQQTHHKPAAAPASPKPKAQAPRPAAPPAPAQNSNVTTYALIGLAIAALGAAGFFALQMLPKKNTDSETLAENTENVSETSSATANTGDNTAPADETQAAAVDEITDPPIEIAGEETAALDSDGTATSDLAADEASVDPTADATADPAADETAGDKTFKDCDACPEMTVLPAGSYMMGSPETEPGRFAYEGPLHEVELQSFAIGAYEVTFDQWAACVKDGGCRNYEPGDGGFGRGARPAMYISWSDAKAYATWLTQKTGRTYRLPTEAEWEYAARGGAETAYWWGDQFDRSQTPNGQTQEVGSFAPNAFGLYDMLGNISEWVEDCYVNNYRSAPANGAAVLNGDCGRRVVRGGSWRSNAGGLRIANRSRISSNTRDRALGFRVAADIE